VSAFLATEVRRDFINRHVAAELQQVSASISVHNPTKRAVDLDDLSRFLSLGKGVHALLAR
jgi:hypothetical protein